MKINLEGPLMIRTCLSAVWAGAKKEVEEDAKEDTHC